MYGHNRVPFPHKPAHAVIFSGESFLSYVPLVYRAAHCEQSLATDNVVRKKTRVVTLLEKPVTEI